MEAAARRDVLNVVYVDTNTDSSSVIDKDNEDEIHSELRIMWMDQESLSALYQQSDVNL